MLGMRPFRVWAYPIPCDLRAGFDTLAELAKGKLNGGDACFLFVNAARNRVKVLHYDGTGWGMYWKRLDAGMKFPAFWDEDYDPAKPGKTLTLTWAALLKYIRPPVPKTRKLGTPPAPAAPAKRTGTHG